MIHQWCHTCISVKVLDNGDTKDRCAAAVGCLDKLAPDIGKGGRKRDRSTEIIILSDVIAKQKRTILGSQAS